MKNFQTMCVRLSALEVALYLDGTSRVSSKNNVTGLLPKERLENPSMPFELFSKDADQVDMDRIITDVLFDRYVEQLPYLQINRDLLQNPNIFGDTLTAVMESGWGRYEILRGTEKKVDEKSIQALNLKCMVL